MTATSRSIGVISQKQMNTSLTEIGVQYAIHYYSTRYDFAQGDVLALFNHFLKEPKGYVKAIDTIEFLIKLNKVTNVFEGEPITKKGLLEACVNILYERERKKGIDPNKPSITDFVYPDYSNAVSFQDIKEQWEDANDQRHARYAQLGIRPGHKYEHPSRPIPQTTKETGKLSYFHPKSP